VGDMTSFRLRFVKRKFGRPPKNNKKTTRATGQIKGTFSRPYGLAQGERKTFSGSSPGRTAPFFFFFKNRQLKANNKTG